MCQETVCFLFRFLKFDVVIEENPQIVFTVGNAPQKHYNIYHDAQTEMSQGNNKPH